MLNPREELFSPEQRRYSAECRRLASIARPPAKRKAQKPVANWLGAVVNQFRNPDHHKPASRRRRLATTWAHR
jgi:hypothetical protein